MKNKKEYNIEESPFYKKNNQTRASLEEIKKGEEIDLVVARKKYFRQDEYIKLIISNELDINEYDILLNISKTILYYILFNCLEYNTSIFRFKTKEFIAITNKHRSTIFEGINDLINHNYIARTTTKEVYWINHNKFYKGSFIVAKHLKEK